MDLEVSRGPHSQTIDFMKQNIFAPWPHGPQFCFLKIGGADEGVAGPPGSLS